jgi:hypothetical protein
MRVHNKGWRVGRRDCLVLITRYIVHPYTIWCTIFTRLPVPPHVWLFVEVTCFPMSPMQRVEMDIVTFPIRLQPLPVCLPG